MSVTLQQIAEAAGVSRGTVDRALNNRGRINPEVADRIRKLAEEMGYQPNRAGRALAMSKRAVTIGVLIQAAETPFMESVIKGAMEAKAEVERLGAKVLLRTIRNMDAQKAVHEMYRLKEAGCNGLAVVPVDDPHMKDTIDLFMEENIPIITFNSDIENSKRLCFVGQDTIQSGKTAAGLMAEILPGKQKVLIISGYPSSNGHRNRTKGFIEELASLREDLQILKVQYAYDNSNRAEQITSDIIKTHPDLAGIYLTASGAEGVCGALDQLNSPQKIKVISNDLTQQNMQYLREGKVNFLIGQDGYSQGYHPVMLLFDKLFDGKDPEKEFAYTDIVIKTRYNLT